MIISASYRTDIPAFYGAWFEARLAAGFCRVASPYGGQPYRVALDAASVDGFVFWTKSVGPFLGALERVAKLGFPFIVQHTINAYPRALEASVPDPARTVAEARALAGSFGPRALVWRYDPILATSETPYAWHRDNFARLADALAGATDEVVVSFAHIYDKTRRNLGRAGLDWRDPEPAAKRELLADLAAAAAERGMALTVCAQPDYLAGGAEPARCVDAARLSDVAGRPVEARLKGNRPGCLCHESRDIGAYDTCPMGCVYCYAVASRARAQARHRAHDPAGEYLVAS